VIRDAHLWAVFLMFATLAGCTQSTPGASVPGDAERGKALAVRHGCIACHAIKDMPAVGRVGPPLNGIARRAILAGRVANTPEQMAYWIRFPRQVDPGTLMPELGISETEARDLTAFLYSLR
jgi:cytochrome c